MCSSAGDAAHLWIPHAGYGMNAGIADAANLSWLLAGVLKGWAAPAMLYAYQAERQPITEQVSRFAFDMAKQVSQQRREISADIERNDAIGDAMRAEIGQEARDLYIQQQCCSGFNFGYFYESSPVIAYDGEPQPVYSMGSIHVVVGAGLPRAALLARWRRRSIYDALGEGFGLLRFDPSVAGGRTSCGCGGEARFRSSVRRHRGSEAQRRSMPASSRWCAPTGTWPGAATPCRPIRWT